MASFTAVLHMAKPAPRFIVQPSWKLRFAAELARLISWAEIASQQPLTRHPYEAHDRSMSSDVHVALASLRKVDKHHYFTHIDWQPNHAATADIVGVLGRALQ
jgi:hypothetical protein